LHLTLLSFYFPTLLTRQYYPLRIRLRHHQTHQWGQSNCRDKGRRASSLVRGSARKAQGNFCLAAKRGLRSDQRSWLFRGHA
jgi:hypothetical protein